MMYKFKKSQILMLFLLIVLLSITPLLSPSLRRTYLYFLINLLIVSLGAEAGLLSIILSNPIPQEKTHDDKNQNHYYMSELPVNPPKPKLPSTQLLEVPVEKVDNSSISYKQPKVVEKSASDSIVTTSSMVKLEDVIQVKKCPSMPSLFFIDGEETEETDDVAAMVAECDVAEEEDLLSGQELYTKAETFIGDFYKQLKMQREDSWKRIHGLYQTALR